MMRTGWRVVLLAALVGVSVVACYQTRAGDAPDARRIFEEKYPIWAAHMPTGELSVRSDRPLYYEHLKSADFREMVSLGAPVIPSLVRKARTETRPRADMLGYAVITIAKIKGPWTEGGLDQWWREGQARTVAQFADLTAKWQGMRTGKEITLWTVATIFYVPAQELHSERRVMTEAGQVYQGIQALGIAILPLLVEQFRQGDYEFVDMARELTDNKPPLPPEIPASAEGKAKSFLAWWEQNQAQWTIPWPEVPKP